MRISATLLLCLLFAGNIFSQEVRIYERPVMTERERTFDVLHYRIDLDIDLEKRSFRGSCTISLVPLGGKFRVVALDAEEIRISKVTGTGSASLAFTQEDHGVKVMLEREYRAGEEIGITLYYSGENPTDGLFFDSPGERNPLILSSNSWPDHARYWFPCYDSPNDKATQEVVVRVNEGLKVLSNGRLEGVTTEGGRSTWHWSQEKPHSTYLSMLAVASFSVISDSLGSLPINYWVYPGDEENAGRIFSVTPSVIEFLNSLYGYEYPWEKYDQVIGPRQGGGAEATSATILGLGAIHGPDRIQDMNWERIIAHEAAHQWWGDLITLRTWSETWMNEGFATYSDHIYTEARWGKDEGQIDLEGKKNSYLREASTRYMRPIVFDRYDRIEDNFDRHTYQKAACVLHMLRAILGDEAFFGTLEYFLHKFEFKSVDTHDFMVAIKEKTGRNMDWFIDQWIYRPGHPVFEASGDWDEDSGSYQMKLLQVQDTTGGIPVYTLPVRIGIFYADGSRDYRDIWIDSAEESFSWELPAKPSLVRFDEGNILLKELRFEKPLEELLFQSSADDVTGRIWAIDRIRNMGVLRYDMAVMDKLGEIVVRDDFWAVRRAALEAMEAIYGNVPGKILGEALKDEDQQVRRAAETIKNKKK